MHLLLLSLSSQKPGVHVHHGRPGDTRVLFSRSTAFKQALNGVQVGPTA